LRIERTGGLAVGPGSCCSIAGRCQNRRKWESRNACGVVDVWVARGRQTDGGTRGAVADPRRGGAGVRAAGLRGVAGPCRRAAGADRSVAMTERAVVIAGGGPTGLMLAGELALAGVDVAIVERRASQDLTV